jgi:hypothetical protein
MQLIGGLSTSFDRRLTSHSQRTDHLHRAGAGFGLSRGCPGQHCPCSRFGIDCVRFATSPTGASIRTVHFDNQHTLGT